jgi:prophage regulatory protein
MSHWRSFLDAEARGSRYLPWKEVARATGLSRTTAWRLQKRDEFPAPYAISPGRVGYREAEVEAWRVSRDHSAARARPSAQPAQASTSPAVPTTDRAPRDAALAGPATPPSSPTAPPRARADPPAKRAKPSRRRSQHAQAIAQQMLFDF